ncbi:hypothetical protein DQ244_09370 [Blastococcus sp. TBT05-19]|uniref:hypothetical protein n=1 Tax=Blastococcus sp. TBT05-19 TaxID=2250581 RepID=UPI000DE8D956|nr:hypothetical protein [Blastococcus sp. TBT05-19]RBY91527.1 hypothetical protein DQ244_09370 [Blastococcus sp. TBT05-19]
MPAVLRSRLSSAWAGSRAPSAEDAVRAAGDLVAAGRRVALEPRSAAPAGLLPELAGRLTAAGLGAFSEVTVPAGGPMPPSDVAVALTGPAGDVDRLAALLPGARVVVDATAPGAADRCRRLAGGRVRLVSSGRGAAADLAFVRCLTVLLAGDGEHAVATTDPRIIAVTGERAAWNGRPPESWEYVMPWGAPTEEQHRLVAAGHPVRVQVSVAGGRA